jgi:HTH-type transcriptional regulator / antitoxin HigA
MKLKTIKNKKEYQACLDWVDGMFDKNIKPDSEEGEKVQIMLLLIKQYEDKHNTRPY